MRNFDAGVRIIEMDEDIREDSEDADEDNVSPGVSSSSFASTGSPARRKGKRMACSGSTIAGLKLPCARHTKSL